MLPELEPSWLVERTRVGVKAAQKRGGKFGQNPKETPERLARVQNLINQGTTSTQTAKMVGVSRATVYRCVAVGMIIPYDDEAETYWSVLNG